MTRDVSTSLQEPVVSREVEELAQTFKKAGNSAFNDGDLKGALHHYNQCLALQPNEFKVLSNRSNVNLRLGNTVEALHDAQKCTQTNRTWPKGHYREGCALLGLGLWVEAKEAFETGFGYDPHNSELMRRLAEAKDRAKHGKDRMASQVKMQRRNVALKLKHARMGDARTALMNQLKQSMAAPEWGIDDFEWRPTFLPDMKLDPCDSNTTKGIDAVMVEYVRALNELSVPKEAIRILHDDVRLKFYAENMKMALEKTPGSHVVVIEDGTGILGLMAANLGAGRVTCIEQNRLMYTIAKESILKNKYESPHASNLEKPHRCQSLSMPIASRSGNCPIEVAPLPLKYCRSSSTEMDRNDSNTVEEYIMESADILVLDIIDHSILGKGLWSCVEHAARKIAGPNCSVIPSKVQAHAMLVDTTIGQICGHFDMSSLNRYLWHPGHARVMLNELPHEVLSDPFRVVVLDLQKLVDHHLTSSTFEQVSWTSDEIFEVPIKTGGTCNSIAMWFELEGNVGSGSVTSYTTSTGNCSGSCRQSLQYMEGTRVKPGAMVDLTLAKDPGLFWFQTDPPQFRPLHATVPRWHFDMLLDDKRNNGYYAAIKSAIELRRAAGGQRVTVLDAGAGSGLLSMISAREGADRVYAAEVTSHMADLCEEVIVLNGFGAVVEVINKDVRRITTSSKPDGSPPEVKEKADICVMEVFDSGLIGEGCFHIFHAAKNNLLTPDATLVPMGATVYFQPIQINRVSNICGSEMHHVNSFHWRPNYEGLNLKSSEHRWTPLAPKATAFDFDFNEVDTNMESAECEMRVEIDAEGVFNAVMFWFDLYLDEERSLSTSPYCDGIGSTWQQAVQFVEERRVVAGTGIRLKCRHDTYGITFEVVGAEGAPTGVPLINSEWHTLFKRMEPFNSNLAKSIAQNPLEYRRVAQTAVKLGARPHDFDVDPHQAAELCARMMG